MGLIADISQVRSYRATDSVVFKKTKEKYGGLSNMAPGYPIRVNGVHIRTSEALYQACRYPHIPEVQRLIIDERSPMTAKMRSRPYRKNSRPDWKQVRVTIMRWCLRVKLAQNWKKICRPASGNRGLSDCRKIWKGQFLGSKADRERHPGWAKCARASTYGTTGTIAWALRR